MFLSFMVKGPESEPVDIIAPVRDGAVHEFLAFPRDKAPEWESPNHVYIGFFAPREGGEFEFTIIGQGNLGRDDIPEVTARDFFIHMGENIAKGGEAETEAREFMLDYITDIKNMFVTDDMQVNMGGSDLTEEESAPLLEGSPITQTLH